MLRSEVAHERPIAAAAQGTDRHEESLRRELGRRRNLRQIFQVSRRRSLEDCRLRRLLPARLFEEPPLRAGDFYLRVRFHAPIEADVIAIAMKLNGTSRDRRRLLRRQE